MLKKQAKFFEMIKRIIDMLLIIGSGFAAYFLRFDAFLVHDSLYYYGIFFGVVVSFCALYVCGTYDAYRGKTVFSLVARIILAWIIFVAVWTFFAFYTQKGIEFSRLWLFYWLCLSFSCVLLFRLALITVLRHLRGKGYNTRQVVIVGSGELINQLVGKVEQARWMGYEVFEIWSNQADIKIESKKDYGINILPKNMEKLLKENRIDELWVALPFSEFQLVEKIIKELKYSFVNIRLIPDISALDLLNHSVSDLSGIPVINIRNKPIEGEYRILKEIEDKFLALGAIILLSPAILTVALLVKLTSKGPIIFKQRRYGLDGRSINVYKFRSMKVHNESSEGLTQATQGDSRITGVGNFIRKSSLDELPQLFNVLQGKLSLVGPRPHAIQHNEYYKDLVPQYMQRHMVKPGITGWAQVSGFRGETDTLDKMEKRVEYDLYYIENWSIAFDLKILWLTVFRGFVNKNAY